MGDTFNGIIDTKQTGASPVASSQGKLHIFILYDYKNNAILAETMNSRKYREILRAYRKLLLYLQKRGLRPKL